MTAATSDLQALKAQRRENMRATAKRLEKAAVLIRKGTSLSEVARTLGGSPQSYIRVRVQVMHDMRTERIQRGESTGAGPARSVWSEWTPEQRAAYEQELKQRDAALSRRRDESVRPPMLDGSFTPHPRYLAEPVPELTQDERAEMADLRAKRAAKYYLRLAARRRQKQAARARAGQTVHERQGRPLSEDGTSIRERVEAAIREGKTEARQIKDALSDLPATSVYTLLSQLVRRGRVKRVRKGVYAIPGAAPGEQQQAENQD